MKESIDIHLDKTISNSARSVLPISKLWPNRFLSDQISSSGIDARFSPELIPIGLGEFQIHVRLTFRTTPTIFLLHAHLPVINGKTRDGIKRERERKKAKERVFVRRRNLCRGNPVGTLFVRGRRIPTYQIARRDSDHRSPSLVHLVLIRPIVISLNSDDSLP